NCPNAPGKLRQAVALARAGKTAEQIQVEMFGGGPKAPAHAEPNKPAPPSAGVLAPAARIDVPADSPSRGGKWAKVTIVEWSDFQCPFCKAVVPTLNKIEQAYGENVRVVFRHQPLSMHQNARLAAEASMAAHEQGKFWDYHDKLFSNQSSLDRASLEQYAGELGLDMVRFKAALDSGRFKAKVDSDAAAGAAVGASGTPAFFINGRQLMGAVPFENFKAMIDEELVKAAKLIASGVKPEKLYDKLLEQNGASPAAAANAPAPLAKIEVGQAPVRGPKNAPVTIVEFSDFQCPYCKKAVPTLHEIEKQYGSKVRVAFKHQPLPFHSNAKLAAVASVAAQEQGKFWEYHDKLFENQQALDRASLERYAGELGLNVSKFKSALDSKKLEARVDADAAEAARSGVQGTPTFFINGQQLVGAQPLERFRALIDEELSKSKKRADEEPKKTARK
ncbi:MAG TPA: thioredoxin domain-containing protein, partial [Myxococcaceae bacterium]|nr:thioredoxin domain-containing protein [Myxococcaceae bacterium]